MFGRVPAEPLPPGVEGFRLFLIGAGGMEHVMVVNVVDRSQVGFGGRADGGGFILHNRDSD